MVATEVHVTPPQAVRWGDAALDLLIESPTNPRTAFDEADLAELAAKAKARAKKAPYRPKAEL